MIRIRAKQFAFNISIATWLTTAVVLLSIVGPILVQTSIAYAGAIGTGAGGGGGANGIPVVWDNGGASISAEFLDSSHIAVVGTGTYKFTDTTNNDGSGGVSEEVNFSGLTGVYYAKDMSNYSGPNGDGDTYAPKAGISYFDETQSTCSGVNSDIVVQSYDANTGVIKATFNPELPITASSAYQNIGACVPPLYPQNMGSKSYPNLSIYDQLIGVALHTFQDNNGTPTAVNYPAAGAAYADIEYYESGGDIYTTNIDSLQSNTPGGDSEYVFKPKSGQTYEQTAFDADTTCNTTSDTITLTATNIGPVNVATYTTPNPNNCNATINYQVLVLTETPAALYATLAGTTGGGGSNTVGQEGPVDNCPVPNWALRWLVCPVITVIENVVAPLNSYIANLITIPVSTFNTAQNPGKSYFAAWGDFRDLAVSLIVIAALIMVIGESAGFDLLDAYSIRKILPRLLTGAIAMTLSWVICTFIIQLFNNLNNWLPDIILSPFQGLLNNGAQLTPGTVLSWVNTAGQVGTGVVTIGATAVAAIVLLSIPGILSLLLSLFTAMVVAFITLTIRTMIIILWLITSPIGIACYILPTTQKGYHFWRDAGTSAFVAGLAIVFIIAAGQLMAIISVTQHGVVPILAPVAIIISYMSIGRAFSMAGGLIGAASGATAGLHNGLQGGLKKYRRGKLKENSEKIFKKGDDRYGNNNRVAKALNPIIKRAGLLPKAIAQDPNIFRVRRNLGRNGRWRTNTASKALTAEQEEGMHIRQHSDEFKALSGDDMNLWATLMTTGTGGEYARTIDPRLTDNAQGVNQALINMGFDSRYRNPVTGVIDQERADQERAIRVSEIMNMKRSTGNGGGLLRAAYMSMGATGTGWGSDIRPGVVDPLTGEIATGDARQLRDGGAQMAEWANIVYENHSNSKGTGVAVNRSEGGEAQPHMGKGGMGATMGAVNMLQAEDERTRAAVATGTMTPAARDVVMANARGEAQRLITRDAILGADIDKLVRNAKPWAAIEVGDRAREEIINLNNRVNDLVAAGAPANEVDDARNEADRYLASIKGYHDRLSTQAPLVAQYFATRLNAAPVPDASNLRGIPTLDHTVLELAEVREGDVAPVGAATVPPPAPVWMVPPGSPPGTPPAWVTPPPTRNSYARANTAYRQVYRSYGIPPQ